MASLIPGFEYDIFISYRQKDNKYDGWVTEFVDNLRKELESMFKYEVSVYFDINPSDYLLESYDVDASLKGKLKCLVFIPIVSRTYCDSKSFAWEHEFKVFVEQASHDQFGLKIKLPNGNVASRVLPIRIHDLDPDDFKLCESVLGGVLRGVEFIYKEPGVNRSLSPKDHEEKNLNNTNYRNQINKVALAVKEIISGLKAEPVDLTKEKLQLGGPLEEVKKEEKKEVKKEAAKSPKKKLLFAGIILAFILVIVAILAYQKTFKRDTLEKLRLSGERISVAVMPFQNMTNDTTWNVWQDGIQNELINTLTNSEDLKVRQTESITGLLQSKGLTNYTSLTPSVASTVSKNLDADVFIYGSIKQSGATIRLNAQIIDSKTQETLESFQVEGSSRGENIFHIVDSLSIMVKNYLIITKLRKEVTTSISGAKKVFGSFGSNISPEAYRFYIAAIKALRKSDDLTAINMASKAIEIDSNFVMADFIIMQVYFNQGSNVEAKKICSRIYKKKDQLSIKYQMYTNMYYSLLYETPNEQIQCFKQLQTIDDQDPFMFSSLGSLYNSINQYDKGASEYEKALEIFHKRDSVPPLFFYTMLGKSYHKMGEYKKEEKLYRKAEHDYSGKKNVAEQEYHQYLIYRQAVLALTKREKKLATKFIEEYTSILRTNLNSEAYILSAIADLYSEADILDKAEEFIRKAFSLEPENPEILNGLAWFLIDKDRNINEGVEFINKALILSPDNCYMLDTKGWGLYKQGKYKEALDFMEKAWKLYPTYDHETFLHLEAAKKAAAGLKND